MMKRLDYINFSMIAILGILAGASLMSIPQTINYFIAESEAKNDSKMIIMAILILAEVFVYIITWLFFENFKNKIARRICITTKQRKIFEINKFSDADALKDDLINKSEVVVENYYKSIFMIFYFVSSLLYAVISMAFINWIISLVLLLLSLGVVIISQFGNKSSEKVTNDLLSATHKFNSDIASNIDGYVFYAFAGQKSKVYTSVEKSIENLQNASTSSRVVYSMRSSFISAMFALLSIIITATSGLLILNDGGTVGVFVSATVFSGFMFGAVSNMAQSYLSIRSCKTVYKEFKLFKKDRFLSKVNGDIIVKNLTVSFGEAKIFENLNMKIKVGEKILIEGKSGRGKTTLIKYLSGSEENGSVYYGKKIVDRKISSNDVMLMENDFLFVDAEKYNELQKVYEDDMKQMNIYNVDPLKASKGELQKIKILYALSQKVKYQFYDEPFSNIDASSLDGVIEKLIKQDSTLVVVAHNLSDSSKNMFDRIINL